MYSEDQPCAIYGLVDLDDQEIITPAGSDDMIKFWEEAEFIKFAQPE